MTNSVRLLSISFAIIGFASSNLSACPFCPPTGPTLSERLAQADAVGLAQWVSARKKSKDDSASTTFATLQVVKSADDLLKKDRDVILPRYTAGQSGDLFLLTGKWEDGTTTLTWSAPEPISETAFQYIVQAPGPETTETKRLKYFLRFLEYPDPLIGDDAYSEFGKAKYEALTTLTESFSREKLRGWITSKETLAPRRGLYGLMLGLCGNDDDAALLKGIILDTSDTVRLGVDGMMGGYLLLEGRSGLKVIRENFFDDPQTPVGETHSAMAAVRFLWTYGGEAFPREELKQAVRALLSRPDVADMAIVDLARWKDWSIQDRLMKVYRAGDPKNPLGDIAIKRAVIRYMLLSVRDYDKRKDPPPRVVKGRKHIETLRELDPAGVKRAERLSGV